ncbi:transcription antitermination factor NusB, partial [Paenibacillus sp.]|uniref:transcription antitermination factor NusB n=1 Tax=Paenibacillus sp. TaxID=58172 RepID=UPI0037C5F691
MSAGGNGADRSAVSHNSGNRNGNSPKAVGKKGGTGNKGKATPASARDIALDILVKVEQQGAYSNLLLNSSLQKSALSREDVGLVTELVYGSISR